MVNVTALATRVRPPETRRLSSRRDRVSQNRNKNCHDVGGGVATTTRTRPFDARLLGRGVRIVPQVRADHIRCASTSRALVSSRAPGHVGALGCRAGGGLPAPHAGAEDHPSHWLGEPRRGQAGVHRRPHVPHVPHGHGRGEVHARVGPGPLREAGADSRPRGGHSRRHHAARSGDQGGETEDGERRDAEDARHARRRARRRGDRTVVARVRGRAHARGQANEGPGQARDDHASRRVRARARERSIAVFESTAGKFQTPAGRAWEAEIVARRTKAT